MTPPIKPFKATCHGEEFQISPSWSELKIGRKQWYVRIDDRHSFTDMLLDTRKLRRLQRWLNEDVFGGGE